MKKHTTRSLQNLKDQKIHMLTCYDYQTAQMLNDTDIDLILVGDSLGNVILGHETTVEVSIDEMNIFAKAVKRGAPEKFVIADMPFGTYSDLQTALKNATFLFQSSKVEALKIEGGFPYLYKIIQRLTETGIPVMGHIGLTPQSVHQQGGYYTHGKTEDQAKRLLDEAINLQNAGAFAIVLECIHPEAAKLITHSLNIPTIGIGSGSHCNGQVLVINDLLKMGPKSPPKFCTPIADLYNLKKNLISSYLTTYKNDGIHQDGDTPYAQ